MKGHETLVSDLRYPVGKGWHPWGRSVGFGRICRLASLVLLSIAIGSGTLVRADDSTAEKPLTAAVARQRVGEKDDVPRIVVDEASQIRVVEPK